VSTGTAARQDYAHEVILAASYELRASSKQLRS
jgi:hypothetical protein